MLTYSFAFDLATGDVLPLLPGVLWTTFLFASIFAGGQSFARETEEGTFDALLLSPVSPTVIYLGKATANVLAMLAIDGILRSPADVDALTAFAIARLQSGIAVLPSS